MRPKNHQWNDAASQWLLLCRSTSVHDATSTSCFIRPLSPSCCPPSCRSPRPHPRPRPRQSPRTHRRCGDLIANVRHLLLCTCSWRAQFSQVSNKSQMQTPWSANGSVPDPKCRVGDRVKKGQTVGIIEAMKLMNEIEAEVSGEVIRVMVDNGKQVTPGQALFLLK